MPEYALIAAFCAQQVVLVAILRSSARERALLLNAALARNAVEQVALNKSVATPPAVVLPGTKTAQKPVGHRNPLGM